MDYRLADIPRRNATERGDAAALTLGDTVVSHAELDRRSNRVAQALAAAGVGEGDRVSVWDLNSLEFFDLWFGCAKLGAVMTPINYRLAPPEVEFIVGDTSPTVFVVGEPYVDALGKIGLPDVTGTVVVLSDLAGDGRVTWHDWIADAADEDPGFSGEEETVVIQLYTSGTTGMPKGVLLDNSNFGTLSGSVGEEWRIDTSSNALVAMPLFHIGGSGWAAVPLYKGAHNVVVREITPQSLLDTMEHDRITNGFLVPAVINMLTAEQDAADRDWSQLRNIGYGASPITSTALKKALSTFGCPMFQVYGLTETCGAVVQLDADDHDPDGPREHLLRSAGKPLDHTEVRIVSPDTGEELPRGETGEILMRSKAVMQGYYERPEETAEAIDDDGWLHTGDAGYRDEDGYLFITDRIKDMIVSGGENIYPIEVEQALAEHDAVQDVAVIGVPHDKWGETVKAVVVLSSPVDEQELIDFAAERIASYKKPTSVDVVDELPRNATGKLLKKDLREPYWEGEERDIG